MDFSTYFYKNRKYIFGLLSALFLYAVYAAWSMRIFYPDGTIFFVHILETVKSVHWHWDRQFAYYIQHFPLIVSIKSGITDIESLARIHSFWYFSFGWMALAACWFIIPKNKKGYYLIPLIWMYALYMNTEFFPITPGRLLTCLFWVIFFLLLFRNGWLSITALILLSWPTFRLYQGMLILGPVLSYLAFWKAVNFKKNDEQVKYFVMMLTGLYFCGGFIASFLSVLNPQDPTSFITFILGILLVFDEELYPHWPQFLSLFYLGFFVWSLYKPSFFEKYQSKFLKIFYPFSVFVLLIPIVWPESLAPETHQQVRSLNIYFTAVLSIVAYLYYRGVFNIEMSWKKTALKALMILGIVQLGWAAGATWRWNQYLEIFKKELAVNGPGLIKAQDTSLLDLNSTYGLSNGLHNDWDTVYMSILFSPSRDVSTIIAHSYGNVYHPVDPYNRETMPDLNKYGKNLQLYFKALSKQDSVVISDRPLPGFFKWFETKTIGENDYFE